MENNIWNKRLAGVPGAVGIAFSIVWTKVANWCATHAMIGNIKRHGKHVIVMRGCIYRYPQWIELGDDVIIGRDATLTAEVCKEYDNPMGGGYLFIRQGVSIGDDCKIDFSGGVTIGKQAHVAHHVQITTHDHGYDYRNQPIGKALEIGEGAFIGSHSVIMHNCNRIGKNAVIGTGSIVTKDVPDDAIVVGNPSRIIKYVTQD